MAIMKALRKLIETGRGDPVEWQNQSEAQQEIAAWLAEVFRTFKPNPPRLHRACFAIVGPSAVGKTMLAIPLRQKLVEQHIPTILIRRDSFIRGKDSGRRWFDDAAVATMRRHVVDWLNSRRSGGDSVCIRHVPETQGYLLPTHGIVLFEDLRRMPGLPIAGGICLIGKPALLTRQEEKRNGVTWSWWEHLRRNIVKYRYQKYLLRFVQRARDPWMVLFRDPASGQFSGWKARPTEAGKREEED
jgi:hypothetical protein